MTDELHEEETAETPGFKANAERRLKDAGLFDEAKKYRIERRDQYRNAGLAKKESKEKSWEDMLSKYPPPSVDAVEPPEIEKPDPTETSEPEEVPVHIPGMEGSMDVARDVAWAYEYLNDQKIRADQAPSGGAWSMLEYGRSARHKFLELVTKYDHSAKDDDDEAQAFLDDAADHTKAIEKLMKITERVHADEIRDAIRQAPDEVERVLRKAGWGVTRPAGEPLEPVGMQG